MQRISQTQYAAVTVTSALIFGVGCFSEYFLSLVILDADTSRYASATIGAVVFALTRWAWMRREAAYVVAAAVFTAMAIIAGSLPLSSATNGVLATLSLAVVASCIIAYRLAPDAQSADAAARVRQNER